MSRTEQVRAVGTGVLSVTGQSGEQSWTGVSLCQGLVVAEEQSRGLR